MKYDYNLCEEYTLIGQIWLFDIQLSGYRLNNELVNDCLIINNFLLNYFQNKQCSANLTKYYQYNEVINTLGPK